MLKRLFASKKCDQLERLDLAFQQAGQFLGRFPNVRPVLNYLAGAVDGSISINTVSDVCATLDADAQMVRQELRLIEQDYRDAYNRLADEKQKLVEENAALVRQLETRRI